MKAPALLLLLLLVSLAAVAGAGPARALEPERREVVVVAARVWDGHAYRETFVPSTIGTVTLMSGEDSALSFVRTLEYYWPLSRRVYVDFERQRDALDGTLRIEKDGVLVEEVPAGVYSIVYPEGAIEGGGHLLWDEEAEAAYAAHQGAERAFARRLVEAQRANTEYERRLVEAGARRIRGEPATVVPPPPPPPEPSLRLVTRPAPGYRVALAPGAYTMELRRDGALRPGTRRALRVVEGGGREALVADVVPEERWTRPLPAEAEAARIFARPGAVFYVTLAEATRFDEAEFLPVVSPQAEAVAGRTTWVRRKPADAAAATVAWDGDGRDLARARLKVEQTRGSGFGYRVRDAAEGETADLEAFPVEVPADPAARRGVFAAADGGLVREIVVVQPRRTVPALLLALVPLAAGLALAAVRRRRHAATART